MALEFRLPDIGEGLAEAEVVEWLVEEGQAVDMDQPLVRVETDKAITDIPAPRAGILLHRGAQDGSVVRVGELLAVIGDPGEAWTDRGTEPSGGDALPIVGTLREAQELSPVDARDEADAVTDPGPEGRSEALPLVRRLAAQLGVDLIGVRGTGPKGRITRHDVEAAASSPEPSGLDVTAGDAPGSGSGPDSGEQRIRMSKLRRTVARNMERSWREIPHVTTFGEADASRLLAAREALAAGRPGSLPLEALFIRAVLPSLAAHPEFNASVDGDDLILKRHYDVGIAVDTAEGLVVAVVRRADRLTVFDLADEVARLGEATRAHAVSPDELTGATFTVSNIGAVGGTYGTPLIPSGTTAILSFGRIEDRPVARGGRVEVSPVLPLSLSYDHRAIDGALGRRFLTTVVAHLQDPGSMHEELANFHEGP